MRALPHILTGLPQTAFVATDEKGPNGARVYRKELVYPGHFVKKDSRGRVEFELPVDETLLDHWVATFNKMKTAGVEVPLPIEHTTDPEQRRGTVVDLRKEHSETRDGPALFAYVTFRDDEAEKLAKSTNVSLFSPPDFVDGKGTKYIRPIRHVALTDYPLIPGLGKFEAVAASLTLSLSEDTKMTMADLAEQMGVPVEDGMTDDEIGQMILDAWNEGGEEEDDFGEGVDPLGEPMPEDEDMGFADDMDDMEDDEEDDEEAPPAMSVQPVAASVVRMVARNRRAELERLTRDRAISPAVRDRLVKKYASEQQVTYALSHETAGSVGDDYDDVVAALSLGKGAYPVGEHSGPQGRREEKNPLIVDAEKRARRARK